MEGVDLLNFINVHILSSLGVCPRCFGSTMIVIASKYYYYQQLIIKKIGQNYFFELLISSNEKEKLMWRIKYEIPI